MAPVLVARAIVWSVGLLLDTSQLAFMLSDTHFLAPADSAAAGTTLIFMPKRGSRRMRFCGSGCRQAAFRAKK